MKNRYAIYSALSLFLMVSCVSAAAQGAVVGQNNGFSVVVRIDPQAQRMLTAFKAWATKWNVPNTSVAIMRGTTLLATFGKGTHTASTAVPVASESKTITAVCIAKLVDAGMLTFNTPLHTVLASYFAAHPPKDVRAKSIKIGQLLTHSSGITYDPSQGNQGAKIEALGLTQTNLDKQATITFAENLGASPGTSYYYNNMNYALLGLVIETVTNTDYESYCSTHVLKPVGATQAKLNPAWRVMASWGGWKISAIEYAHFLEYLLPSQKLLKATFAQWPKFSLGGGAYYTLGALTRANGRGNNFWHAGSWLYNQPSASFGGYYTVIGESVRYMANYEPTLSDAAVGDLDSVMYNAAVAASIAKPPLTAEEITH